MPITKQVSTTGGASWTGGTPVYQVSSASIMGWFNHPSQSLATNDFFFDIHAAFNIRVDMLLNGVSAPAHKVQINWRTPTALAAVNSTNSFDDGEWHRFLVVRNPLAPYLALYIDGNLEGSDSTNNPTTDPTAADGMGWMRNVQGGSCQFQGALAHCAIVTGVSLTSQQADEFLLKHRPPVPLSLWHEMNCGSGSEIDRSGNGIHATLTNVVPTGDYYPTFLKSIKHNF